MPTSTDDIALELYRFRGEFLHWFAVIEDHIGRAVQRLVEKGLYKKTPYLFGQKFEATVKSTDHRDVWTHPQHVRPILDELKPFVSMRSLVAHGLIEPAKLGEDAGLSISPSGDRSWENRSVLSTTECNQLLDEIKSLTNRLTKQKLKPINPASSPPPPSPAATADP